MEISTTLIKVRHALEAAEVDADGTITVTLDGATVRLRLQSYFANVPRPWSPTYSP
jgi:hypothetical protein